MLMGVRRQDAATRRACPRPGGPGRGAGRTAAACVMVLVTASVLAGCGGDKKAKPGRLSPRGVPFLTGIAVPNGFQLVDEMSMDQESGGVRYAKHLYRGSADPFAVRDFYLEQMPLNGWNSVSTQNVKGVISIRFEKLNEVCTVQIEKGAFNRVTVQIIVAPFSRNQTGPPKRPVP